MRAREFIVESVEFEQMQPQNIVAVAQQAFAQLYPDVKLYGRSVVEGVGLTTAKGGEGSASAFAGSDTKRGAFYLTLNAYAEGDTMIVVIEDATAGNYKGAATAVIKSLFEAGERLYKTQQRELVVNNNANAEAWSVIADRVGAEIMESAQLAEGSEQITELRDRMYQYIKSIVPTWPNYVVQDWLYKGSKTATKDDIIEKISGAGLTPNSKWQLVPNMKFTMAMFDPMTKQRLIGRAGGTSDLGMGIPKDKERHATQASLAQQQGGVRKEPVLLIKTAKGYELLEGWHRTIQHFAKYPEGYTGPAYVSVAQGQQGIAEAVQDRSDHSYTTAYHITGLENAEEIMYGGLDPRDGKAFLVVDEGDPKKLRDELYTVYGWLDAKAQDKDEEFTLLQVDVRGVPLAYEFGWHFSTTRIPASRIQDLGPDTLARYV